MHFPGKRTNTNLTATQLAKTITVQRSALLGHFGVNNNNLSWLFDLNKIYKSFFFYIAHFPYIRFVNLKFVKRTQKFKKVVTTFYIVAHLLWQ